MQVGATEEFSSLWGEDGERRLFMANQTAAGLSGAGGVDVQAEARRLLTQSRRELDELYAKSLPGTIPIGESSGTCVFKPGTFLARPVATFARWFLWQGKIFDPAKGELVNKISPLRLRSIRAKVYEGESWHDHKPSIIIDYSQTSFVAKKIRDEMRQVSPGLYLGKVYLGSKRLFVDFVLAF